MTKTTLHSLLDMKRSGEKIACLTAYDATQSHLVSSQKADIILVGDSVGMVVQGHESTVPVTMEDMLYHTRCVARGNTCSLVMADLPFMACATLDQAYRNAAALMQAGADMVKIEGGSWLCETVSGLAARGIPTCLHLGLTPQSVSMLGGYKVQGKDPEAARKISEDAHRLEAAGADMLLLECVPTALARDVSCAATVPVIGIGAGADTDGQILVFYDVLGMTPRRVPRFAKNFMSEESTPAAAVSRFVADVKSGLFPASEHSFGA
ncbi:MAG: 3-methyl-2-oxobutanoate hydroxymethyltransferase [Kistimonas sp.]|nr:3-methyl-2-oxobutanoate hydroxymethyltransferase [Kistimonas sp.]